LLHPILDTELNQKDPDKNYGTDITLEIGEPNEGESRRGVFLFDFSPIPAGAVIQYARLRLWAIDVGGSGSITIRAYALSSSWNEGATWNTSDGITPWSTPGGVYDPTIMAVSTVPLVKDRKEWVLPPGLIHEWIDGVREAVGTGLAGLNISNTFNLRIGYDRATAPYRYAGMIDEMAIYNQSLSAEEISEIQKGLNGFLVRYSNNPASDRLRTRNRRAL